MTHKILLVLLSLSLLVSCGSSGGGGSGNLLPSATIQFLLRDGVTLKALDATPIPRAVSFKVTFERALTADEKVQAENAFQLLLGANELSVSFAWSTGDACVIVVPARRFDYGKSYSVGLDPTIVSGGASTNFTVMAKNDINGDGFSDVAVTQRKSSGSKVYIYNGAAAGLSTTASSLISCSLNNQFFGYSLSYGDINADGFSDIAVSRKGGGVEHVFFGSSTGIASCDVCASECSSLLTITHSNSASYFGASSDLSGDLNGDGFDDLAVGATAIGKVYLFQGGVSWAATSLAEADANAVIIEKAAFDWLGTSMSSSGDFNNDGYDDLAVSAFGAGSSLPHSGAVYIFNGLSSGIASCDMSTGCLPNATITGAHASDYIGSGVGNAGDINGDGYDDLLVGAGLTAPLFKGYASIFMGSSGGISSCDLSSGCIGSVTIIGVADGDGFGFTVSGLGDIDLDGYDDISMSAPWVNGITRPGKSYIFYGQAAGFQNCDLAVGCPAQMRISTTIGRTNLDFLGISFAGMGDVNRDGFSDLIIGSPGAGTGGLNQGQAYVFNGSTTGITDCDLAGACVPNVTFTGEQNGDSFGMVSNAFETP